MDRRVRPVPSLIRSLTLLCSTCASENEPGRKFCRSCGSRLGALCAVCGTFNAGDARFCGECGAPLGGTASAAGSKPGSGDAASTAAGTATRAGTAAASPDARAWAGPTRPAVPGGDAESERRIVSVLFADLVGFTPFAEGRDAEAVRDTLSRYFERASEVIGRHGGTVEKFIGDAVMAVWGAPTAHEDDAERAVRTALELVDTVRLVAPGVMARAAVVTGEAAVTVGAVNQGLVAGDLVNTASRLQSVAPAGGVLVDEATQRASAAAIAFEEAGEQMLKGRSALVAAWLARRVVAERGGRNRRDELEAPFVGRDDELRLLKDLFHATTREHRARLVSVIGPAGIGKSRLAWEFLKYIDGLLETVWWHDGRSPAYGDGLTFWALGEMVRGRAGLLETDDEATTRVKLAATVAEHVSDPEERAWIEAAFLALLGFGGDVASDQLFAAWRTFFERLASTAPVVMVFGDFHWADGGLIDFVDHLLEWSRNAPIYVVTLARPDLLERRPTWGAGKRNYNALALEPLPDATMRQLLGGLVPGLPPAAVRAIVSRADGIPLYAIETVRMLVAQGRLTSENGVYRPTADLGTLAIPETLAALVAARLDALSPDERRVVADASVLGQSFTVAAVAAVADAPVAEVEPHLRALVRRDVLEIEVDPRSPERGQYAFVQALIREVAYKTLARPERHRRHLAAARYFEGIGSDELSAVFASQWLGAYASAPDGEERDALAAQARVALRAAATRATALGANDQAGSLLRQALDVAPEPRDRADLLERLGEGLIAVQRFDDADTALREAIKLWQSIGDRLGAARATEILGRGLTHGFRLEAARTLLEAAATEYADLADKPAMVALRGQVVRVAFLRNDHRRAIAESEAVLAAAEAGDLPDVLADTLVTKGSALCNLGRRYEGIALIEAGKHLAEQQGLSVTTRRALNNLSSNLYYTDPAAALAAVREGIELMRRIGNRSFTLFDNAFSAGLRTGDWGWVRDQLEAAVVDESDPIARGVLLSDLVSFAALRGEPLDGLTRDLDATIGSNDSQTTRAIRAFTAAIMSLGEDDLAAAESGMKAFVEDFAAGAVEGHLWLARIGAWRGDRSLVAAAIAALDAEGVRGGAADGDRASMRAAIAALDGRAREAKDLIRRAAQTYRDLALPWDLGCAAITAATVLDPSDPDLAAIIADGRRALERLGAKPFVARLDALVAAPRSQDARTERAEAVQAT